MDNNQEYTRTFADYVAMIRRRWRTATVCAVVTLAVGTAVAALWPPVYRATATILIEQQEIPQDLVRSTITSYADQRIQLINQRVMTTSNLLQIIREHGLYAEDFDRKPREVIIDRMRRDIHMDMISANVVDPRSGQPTSATIAFTVGYDNRSPQLSTQVANELTTLYLQQNSQNRRQQAAEASAFLADETQRLSTEIAGLATKVAEFKQANVDRLPELAALNQQLLSRAEQDLSDVQRQRNVLDERRGYLEAQLAQLSPSRDTGASDSASNLEPADRLRALESYLANVAGVYSDSHPDVIRTRNSIAALRTQLGATDGGAGDVEQELADLQAQRTGLVARYEPAHPDVVRIERQIAAAQQRLDAARASPTLRSRATNPAYVQIQSQLASDGVERESVTAKGRELRARIDDIEKRVLQGPAVERDYSALMRDLENARAKYQEVSAKQREAVVSQNLEMDSKAERFNLIEPPLLPERPVSPNRWLILLLSLVLAIVAAVSGVALREAVDGSIRGAVDFERLLGISPLGVIPAILTAADRRRDGRRRVQAIAAVAVTALVVVALAHTFIAPLDAIWFGALRRFGA